MEMKEIPISQIIPNPLQPREIFDKDKLKELAATIADVGVLQPILVRPTKNNHYEIIAGERRWKATQIAGIDTIPALIKPIPDSQVMVESLIENVHRANLKPMEQAKAILEVFKAGGENFCQKFIDDRLPQKISGIDNKHHGRYTNNDLTKEEVTLDNIVKRIGLTHIVVYKSLKLLSLPESIRIEATEKGVAKPHLASISGLEGGQDQREVFDIVVEKELSEKDTAALTKVVKSAPEPVKRAVLDAAVPVEVAQTIINTKRSDDEQEAMVNIAVDKHLSKEDTEHLTSVVETAPEPVKRAVLDTDLDMGTAEEISVAFEDLPDDAAEQVTEEVVEMVSKGRTEDYITRHIETRQGEAKRMADPMWKEPVEHAPNKHERYANGIIKRCQVVRDIFPSLIVAMPKIYQDRSVAAILAAHRSLEYDIQFLREKGLLTDDSLEAHRTDCALQLTEGIPIPENGTEDVEFIDADYEVV